MAPAPSDYHQALATRLLDAIKFHLGPNDAARCMFAPMDVLLDELTVVQPDLLLLPEGARCTGLGWEAPRPIWVAEILSRSTAWFDRGPKREACLDAGIQDYWIIDPDESRVESHRAHGSSVWDRGDTATMPVLPGFALDVASYFAFDAE